MNLHTKQDALPKGRQALKPTVAPPSPPRRSALAIAMLLGALVALSRAQSPLPDSFNPGANSVSSLAVQADGKILVGESFATLGGQPRERIRRLNPDGTLDATFNPGANPGADSWVFSLAVQADGKILVGGSFSTLGGQPRNRIGRINPDGTLDATFNPGASDRSVNSLAVQADGKILVGGYFTTLGGQPRNNLGRLNPDGTIDRTFNPGAGQGGLGSVYSLALQADGKILVGGRFTTLDGQPRERIGRLNPDGTLDATFNPGANYDVFSLAVQADGKILVGGFFTTLRGQTRNSIGRINPDGTLDPTFNPGVVGHVVDEEDPYVDSLALQADGKILVGGGFTTLGGQPRNNLGRLNQDGALDPTFNPGANYDVYSLAVQADGKILVGGYFTALSGQERLGIGRLNNTGPATQVLSHDGSTITWMRGGTSPEVWRTTFESSADGLKWTFLGAGIRIQGGWELAGVSVSPESILRARGFVAGGSDSSGWFAETTWMAPPVVIGLDLVGDGVDITVSSVAGRYYTLQTTATLDVWADVPGAVAVAGTGAALVLHPAAPGQRLNFYRVVARWSP